MPVDSDSEFERIIRHPHDRIFKITYGSLEEAKGFLQAYLPGGLVDHAHWDTLERLPGSYIDPEFAALESDLLFKLRVGSRQVLIYALLEHQSTADPEMPLRLLGYMLAIWREARNDGRELLPVILPVVLHQGESEWKTHLSLGEMLDWPGDVSADFVRRYVPDFAFELVDLAVTPAHQLRGTAKGRFILDLMKVMRHQDRSGFVQRWTEFLESLLETADGRRFFCIAILYLMQGETDAILRELKEIPNLELSKEIMTVAQQLMAQGREEGREQGRELGHQEGLEEGLRAQIQSYAKLLRSKGHSCDLPEDVSALPLEELRALAEKLEAMLLGK